LRVAHEGFNFRELHDRVEAHFRLNALDDVDHAFQRMDWQARKVAGLAEHRLLHKCIARTHRHTVAARDAARVADPRASIPQNAWIWVLPTNAESLVYLEVLARFDTPSA